MPNRVKGITIEIDGSTKGLDKALSGVNKQASSTSKELRDVNRLLKLNPGNVELVAQKQELLTKQVANTSAKLQQLKSAQAQVDAEYKRGDIGAEQYRAFNREIQATEGQLNGYKGQLKNVTAEQSNMGKSTETLTRSTKQVGSNLEDVANKSGKVGKAMSVGVTAPVVAAGTAGLAAFKTINDAETDVITQTGATGKQAESLRKSFENVAGNSPASLDDISASVGTVKTRFNLTGKALDQASIKFLQFAAVNKVDVKTAVTTVSHAMGDAGIKSKDYGKVLDMLTVAHQKSGIAVDKLAQSLANYGAPMRQLGFDTKSSIAIFSGWEKAGVNTSIAFSGMKKAISNWGAAGKQPMKEFPKAMEKIKNSTNPTADAIKIFGAKAGPDLADAIKGGRFAYSDYAKALTSSNGQLVKSAQQMDTPYKSATKIQHEFQVIMAQTGRVLIQTVAPSMTKLLKNVQGLAMWFGKLSPQAKTNAIAFAGIAAAIGPTLVGFAKTITAVKTIKDTFGKVVEAMKAWNLITKISTAVQSAFNVVMNANPIALIVLAIAALVAGLTLFLTKTKTGQQIVKTVTAAIRTAWQGVANFLGPIFSKIGSISSKLWNNSLSGIKSLGKNIRSTWNSAGAYLSQKFSEIGRNSSKTWNSISSSSKSLGTKVKSHWMDMNKSIANELVKIAQNSKKTWGNVQSGAASLGQNVKNIWSSLGKSISNIFSGIGSTARRTWGNITSFANEMSRNVKSIWSNLGNSIKNLIITPINWAKNRIISIGNEIKGFFGNLHLSIPRFHLPPMPHFKIHGGFSFNPPKAPSISVKWYANGAIFNKPTLFNGPTGLSGAGDAGPEAMLPLDKRHLQEIGNGIAKSMKGGNQFTFNVNVSGADGSDKTQLANEIADTLERKFRQEFNNQSYAWGGGSIA